jgi:hypothetical protein
MDHIGSALEALGWREDSAEARRLERERQRRRTVEWRLVGIDVGQRNDYTALAALDLTADDVLTLVALERVRHLAYPEVAELIRDTVTALSVPDSPTVLVDVTGVGRPVTDQLERLHVSHTRVNIHGGSAVTRLDDGTLSVPKRDLISALVVGFEGKTLRIAGGLKHAGSLEHEAAAFTMKLSASGHDTYNAREGEHDDLLLAVALSVWYARQHGRAGVWFA